MLEAKYLVSICIPTYNRAPYLKKCLDSLICQPEFLQGEVEIVVSDNCSTDHTREVVQSYKEKYSNIQYYRNEENLKDKNFPRCLMRGNGILRKLSNDTLLFKKGSLELLCNAVREHKKIRPLLFFGNGNLKNIKKKENVQTSTLNDFFYDVSFLSTWIGAFALWADDCENLIQSEEKCSTSLWQVWELCHLLQKDRPAVLYNEHIMDVQYISKKDVSYGIFQVFYHNYLGIIQPFADLGAITQECFDYLEKDLLFGFFMNAIIEWELNHNHYRYSTTENLKEAVWDQYRARSYFEKFSLEYSKQYSRARVKRRIKNIPVLGTLLVKLKHAMQGW